MTGYALQPHQGGLMLFCDTCGFYIRTVSGCNGSKLCKFDPSHGELTTATPNSHNLVGQEVPGRRGNNYLCAGVIGYGAFGTVYRAIDLSGLKWVAIKVFDERSDQIRPQTTFDMEAQAYARIFKIRESEKVWWPSGLPRVYGQLAPPHSGIVFQLIRGKSLKERLRHGRLDSEYAKYIGLCILSHLASLHTLGIIHRDVNPANIMLGDKKVWLIDLGTAWLLPSSRRSPRGIVGTPSYVAPEQITELPPVPQTDLYSLGVTLFEMVEGRKPFEAPNDGALYFKHLQDPPPHPQRADPEFRKTILRALQKQPEDRYGSAMAMYDALKRTYHPD